MPFLMFIGFRLGFSYEACVEAEPRGATELHRVEITRLEWAYVNLRLATAQSMMKIPKTNDKWTAERERESESERR